MNAQAIKQALTEEFSELVFARDTFPMLTTWGVKDESINIHSLGCNYLSALGRQLGFWAMNEYPVRANGRKYIRPDVVWWSKPEGDVALIGEFERYEPGQQSKLVAKARNLMETYQALERKPHVILLMAWTMAGTDLGVTSDVCSVAFEGCRTDDGQLVKGLEPHKVFVLAHAIFGRFGDQQRLLEVKQ